MSGTGCRRCRLLASNRGFCRQLQSDEIERLSLNSRSTLLPRKTSLDCQTIAERPIVLTIEGIIGIQHTLSDGRSGISAFYTPGDIIDLRRRSGSVRGNLVALTPAQFCSFDAETFDNVLKQNPSAQHVASEILREQIHLAADHSFDLGKKRSLERLASFIFECHNRQRHTASNGSINIEVPMRHCDVGEYLGLQPETVSRGFRELARLKLIVLPEPSRIVVKNTSKLRRVANGARSDLPG